jgi:hypothetical protein
MHERAVSTVMGIIDAGARRVRQAGTATEVVEDTLALGRMPFPVNCANHRLMGAGLLSVTH